MYEKVRTYLVNNHILATLVIVAVAWLVWQLRILVVIVFIVFLIVIGFLPATRFLQKQGTGRVIAAITPYVAAFGLIILVIAPFFVQVSSQMQSLIDSLVSYWEKLPQILQSQGITVQDVRSAIQSQFQSFAENLIGISGGIVAFITAVSTTVTMSIYAQIDYDRIRKSALQSLGRYVPQTDILFNRLEDDLGAWIYGQAILCVTIGLLSFIVLSILGIPFAASLALLAGLLELLPTIGPILAGIPAVLIALEQSFTLAIIVTLAYVAIQVLENTVIVPRVMQRAVNMHPLVIIPALIVGFQFLGILGAMLAIPFLVMARILWSTMIVPKEKPPLD